MNKNNLINSFVLALSLIVGTNASSEESTLEKVETSKNKAVDSVKTTYRDVKDKSCEMVNGKMECVGKKIKNKVKNMSDKIDTKATEVKNKAD